MEHDTQNLPIYNFKDQIVSAVDSNQVVIITAETGAGKSTQVPQFLAEAGYTKVIVTQPRILAARNLARRVREEWALRNTEDSEFIIGYRTAHERDDDPSDKILYCTDGLQLVRELTGAGTGSRQVLVLDEVHEWNENMEVLVAWAKKRCLEDPSFKVVIMSATIETDTLAGFFGTTAIINVPGRSHDVKWKRGTSLVNEIAARLEGPVSNILVFLPGKAEIADVARSLRAKAAEANVPLLSLHSGLEASEQQLAFASYPQGKVILSTNIAQTSVTIDDIDVVVDSGLERRSEVRSGVEGLFIVQTSQADCRQRAGRAGRTKAGEYVLAPYDTFACQDFEKRPPYGTPEILRKHIDRLTLRLANIGIDIEELDFYHDPSNKAIRQAKQTLIALGALTKKGDVTRIGKIMEGFPVQSSYGRMLAEAQRFPKSVQIKLAAIIGIQEVDGIVRGGTRYTGWRAYTKQTSSDLLAEYDVFLALDTINPELYEELGILGKNVEKARETMERLEYDLGLDYTLLTPLTEEEGDSLRECIVAGQIDQLWSINVLGDAVHLETGKHRELSSSTVVRRPRLLTGTPFDLQIPTRSGELETLHLLQNVTKVNGEWLVKLLPESFKNLRTKEYFDPQSGGMLTQQRVKFRGKDIEADSSPSKQRKTPVHGSLKTQYANWVFGELESERAELKASGKGHFPAVPLRLVEQQVNTIIGAVRTLEELSDAQRSQLINLAKLKTQLGPAFMRRLKPSGGGAQGRRRGWKPKHKRRER